MLGITSAGRMSRLSYVCLAFFALQGCAWRPVQNTPCPTVYKVLPCDNPPVIDADWSKPFWMQTPSLALRNHMGATPDPFPATRVKMRYDQKNLYLIFRVDDQFVRAAATKTHGKVWQDSCVEFFFSPEADTHNGYFNLETNCMGVFLFQSHNFKNQTARLVDAIDCSKIEIAHSLTVNTTEEIQHPITWTLEYRLPIAILNKYLYAEPPRKGTRWRANFYKCAETNSHPHWLTWAKVVAPQPNFHLPEFFGSLEFE